MDSVVTREQDSAVENGFTVFEKILGREQSLLYPSPISKNIPCLLTGGPPVIQAGGPGHATTEPRLKIQQSQLDGVHFSLNPRLNTDEKLQYMGTALDSVLDKVKSIEWEAMEYNFVLEKTFMKAISPSQ